MHFFTTLLAFIAFALSAVTFYLQINPSPPSLMQQVALPDPQDIVINHQLLTTEAGNGEIDVEQLQASLNQLNQRLVLLENALAQQPVSEEDITQVVEAYVAKKEKQEKEKRQAQDPFYSFYEDLPEDYEQKLKTDPEYAAQVQAELKAKVLDSNLSDEERLKAMAQLQMTAGMLADYSNIDKDNQLSDAILNIVGNTNDEKIRIRALETVTSSPSANPKLAPKFMELVQNDSNSYVRNLAANGLGMVMFSRELDNNSRQQLANNIIQTMRTTSDSKLRAILEQNFGSEQDIQEMLKHMQEQPTG